MNVGVELARARERRGLSLDEMAARIGTSVPTLAAIEDTDVRQLPPLIALRSVLRACANELGLDAPNVITRYLSQIEEASVGEFDSENERQHGDDALTATAAEPFSPAKTRARSEFIAVAAVGLFAGFMLARVVLDLFPSKPHVPAAPSASSRWTTGEPNTSVGQSDIAAGDSPRDSVPSRDLATYEVSGLWTMMNEIESTDYRRFKDLTLQYRLQLEQDGTRVTGRGQKWLENGRLIASRGRTPITVNGTFEGRRLVLSFTEEGTRRASNGTFVMQLADDGSLQGRFASDAARSSGSSRARRVASFRE